MKERENSEGILDQSKTENQLCKVQTLHLYVWYQSVLQPLVGCNTLLSLGLVPLSHKQRSLTGIHDWHQLDFSGYRQSELHLHSVTQWPVGLHAGTPWHFSVFRGFLTLFIPLNTGLRSIPLLGVPFLFNLYILYFSLLSLLFFIIRSS